MIPAHCSSCQLCFKNVKTWKIPNEYSSKKFDDRSVLFVLSKVDREDDQEGKLLAPATLAGKFFRAFLSGLDDAGIGWAVTSVTRCGTLETPTEEQIKICSSNYLQGMIKDLNPRIIVALGLDAWYELVGQGVRADVPKQTPEGTWVIPSYHPYQHAIGRIDMRPHLNDVATWIWNIFEGKYETNDFSYTRIHSKNEALHMAQKLSPTIFMDVETEYCGTCPTKLNYWGRDAELIMVAVTDRPSPGVYRNYVLEGEAICGEVLKAAVSGRTVINHNIGFDINAIYRFTNVCMFKHAAKIRDTMFEHWFSDQSSIRNGLKELTQRHFLVPNYADELKQEVVDVNKAYHAEERERISKENKIRVAKRRELGIYSDKSKNDINFEEEETHTTIVSEMIYDHLGLSESERLSLRSLWKQQDTLGYKYVNRDRLAKYAAQDTYFTAKLFYEVLEERSEEEKPDPRIMKLAYDSLETLCKVSRVGLPLNMDKVVALRELTKQKVLDLYRRIINYPQAHQAIVKRLPKVRAILEKYEKSKNSKKPISEITLFQSLCHQMNPASKLFCAALIDEFSPEVLEWAQQCPKGGIKIDKDVMKVLGNVRTEENRFGYNYDEDRTDLEWLWHDIYWYKQNIKTLNEFLKKFVGYRGIDGSIHPSYHLTSTVTGRTASKDPNGQNLKNDPAIMACFECSEGEEFWGFDYVSMEPVTMAIVAGIPAWKEVFINQYDLYSMIANDVYHKTLKESGHWIDRTLMGQEFKSALNRIKKERPEVRKLAKTGTLGKTYGQSMGSFARMYKQPLEEVKLFYEGFAEAYPELDQYVENTEREIKEKGVVYNAFGRRRKFKFVRDRQEHSKNLREAANYKIQSAANDIALRQAHRCMKFLEEFYPEVKTCNYIHDAVYFKGPKHLREEVVPKLKAILEDSMIEELKGFWDPEVPIRTTFKHSSTLAGLLDD